MTRDIFQFWTQIAPQERVHPADVKVMKRVRHGFDLNCLPVCFLGPLRTARVVLLFLSPGLNDQDPLDARSKRGQRYYVSQRTGTAPLPGPQEHNTAWRWWKSRTKRFGEWHYLRTRIAVLNIGAYHSKTFNDEPLLAALPSSRLCLDWAQRVLFPAAERGERTVVCLRSASFWGLEVGKRYGHGLFAPRVTRGGYLCEGKMRDEVVNAVKAHLS